MKLNFNLLLICLLFVGFLSAQEAILEEETQQPINFKPVLKSLLIPGWGELSTGAPSGYAFLALEIILWGSKFYMEDQQEISQRKAFNYAVQYGGIDPELSYDDQYYDLLKKYDNWGFEPGGYNYQIMQQAIAQYPGDAELQNSYIAENGIDAAYSWEWESYEDRKYFAARRTDMLKFSDRAKAAGGVIIANHLLSAANSLRLSRQQRFSSQVFLDKDYNPGILFSYSF
ncbi:MAG: hypothetical protein R6U84_07810 [Candidatus Cloacimonadales bacterium]